MKMKIKTIFAFSLVLVLLFVSVLPAFAAEPVKVKLDIAGENGKVYVRFTAPANSDIATVSLSLKFDADKLTYSETTYLTGNSIVSLTNDSEASSGIVKANLVIADSLMAETKMFTFVFNVNDGAEGEASFEITETEATNSANQSISLAFDGALTADLNNLAPLTPDVIAPDYSTPPTSEGTEPSSSETTTEAVGGGSIIDGIPGTGGKVAIGIAAGAVIVVLTAAFVIAVQRKKKTCE